MVPIEHPDEDGEDLLVIERRDADFVTRNLGAVRFVPLTGEGRR